MVYLRNDTAPRLYSIFRNPGLARAYRMLQDRGRDAFYDGPIADAIIRRVNRGAAMRWTRDDLSSFRSEWVMPISTNYKGYDVYETPNTQGWAPP